MALSTSGNKKFRILMNSPCVPYFTTIQSPKSLQRLRTEPTAIAQSVRFSIIRLSRRGTTPQTLAIRVGIPPTG